ncbi:MAG: hypothetical protein KTR25_18390 [Myxococcales bacterium]|nr:hypothetical protein [Myxococcales bacterium]
MELDSAEMRIEGFSSQSMARAEKLSTGITVSWPVAFFVSVSLFFSGLVLGYVAGMVQLLKDFLSY